MKEVLSHPLFKDYDIEKFMKRELDPPFTPDPNTMKFFNADQNSEAIADTYIPRDNKKMIQQNNNQFADFERVYTDDLTKAGQPQIKKAQSAKR